MNLYVHFPFCRAKCAYCALLSRVGSTPEARRAYCTRLAADVAPPYSTIYFGGGSPALCDLTPLFEALRVRGDDCEFTVELHPLDARPDVLEALREGGVNRISMGVQSLDDGVLKAMGRLHTAAEAEAAFRAVRAAGFTNAGIDLIAGWPGATPDSWRTTLARATALGLDHCSVYTLIREPKTRLDLMARRGEVAIPGDDAALAQIDEAREAFSSAGLARYEVSNYALPGFECRHNLAVWRGEDYTGIGEGAHGREGLARTVGLSAGYERRTVTAEEDAVERALLSLRTASGLDLSAAARRWPILAPRIPSWLDTLCALAGEGILRETSPRVFAPTSRGFEVCDAVMSALL
jgi:oxygen-independent coproporphyrinogen-3 oxidase